MVRKNSVDSPVGSSAGAWQVRLSSGSSSNLLESHKHALEPQPGEQQHDHHVGEGKSKPRGEVQGVSAVRKQPGERNTGPHLYQMLSHREQQLDPERWSGGPAIQVHCLVLPQSGGGPRTQPCTIQGQGVTNRPSWGYRPC